MCAYFTDHDYLERVPWVDGTAVYCRECDAKTEHDAKGTWLRCRICQRQQHAANAVVSGELAR